MRLSVAVAIGCLALTSLSAADRAAAAIKKQTNIASQSLGSALQELATDRDLDVLYRTEVVGNRHTSGAVGEFTFDEALIKLLNGSGLTFRYLDDTTVTILSLAEAATTSGARASSGDRLRLAQTDEATGATPSQPSAEASSPAQEETRSSADQQTIQEVIVTAQKRTERLQDVPISMSVLQGDDLDRSSSMGIVDALRRVPGVSPVVAASGTRSNRTDAITIRGVASQGGSAATAYYLDSIPFSFIRQAYAVDASAYDLERVEVLRGPQGTLYGASALNGVVRILTQDADPTRFEGKTRVGVSHTAHGEESYRGDLAVNVPFWQNKAAVRAVVGYQTAGGWIDKPIGKDANDAELGNYRLKLKVLPTENLSLDALTWISRSRYDGHAGSPDNRSSPSIYEEPSSTDFDAFGFQATYNFPQLTVSSMTSYIDFSQTAQLDFSPADAVNAPHSRFINQNKNEISSQEFLLNSNSDGPWRWSAGAYFRHASEQLYSYSYHALTGVGIRSYQAPTVQVTKSDAFAVFGDLSRAFLDDRIEITAGLRYFEDKIKDRELSRFTWPNGIPPLGLQNSEGRFDKLSPRAVLNWRPSANLTIYTSYAQGFRSGINQLPTLTELAPEFPSAKPDKLDNYEIGAKGELLGGRLSFDTALYYLEWKDVQQSLGVIVRPPNTGSTALVNAGSASGPGIDIGLVAELLDDFTVSATFNWNELESDEDVLFNGRVFTSEGGRLSNSPERTVGFAADYRTRIGQGYETHAQISANYVSAVITGRQAPSGTAPYIVVMNESNWTSRASVDLLSPRRWVATLYVDNLFNEDALIVRDTNSPLWSTYMRPRTVGVQMEYKF